MIAGGDDGTAIIKSLPLDERTEDILQLKFPPALSSLSNKDSAPRSRASTTRLSLWVALKGCHKVKKIAGREWRSTYCFYSTTTYNIWDCFFSSYTTEESIFTLAGKYSLYEHTAEFSRIKQRTADTLRHLQCIVVLDEPSENKMAIVRTLMYRFSPPEACRQVLDDGTCAFITCRFDWVRIHGNTPRICLSRGFAP